MSQHERNRHQHIDEMERLYLDRAWSDQEMADRLGTDRTNVWKIRTRVMEAQMGIPFITEDGRHRIDPTSTAPCRFTAAMASPKSFRWSVGIVKRVSVASAKDRQRCIGW